MIKTNKRLAADCSVTMSVADPKKYFLSKQAKDIYYEHFTVGQIYSVYIVIVKNTNCNRGVSCILIELHSYCGEMLSNTTKSSNLLCNLSRPFSFFLFSL